MSTVRAEAAWLAPFVVAAAALGVLATTKGGLVAVGIAAGAFLSVLAYRAPHWVLAPAVFLALAGGTFTSVTSLGQWALVLGGIIAGVRLLTVPGVAITPATALALVTWGWISFRVALETGSEFLTPGLACLGAILLTIDIVRGNSQTWLSAMAWSAFAYMIVSQVFGVMDPSGTRFEGITGNPNRFAVGMLIAVTLMAHSLVFKVPTLPRIVAATGTVGGVLMLAKTGSSQVWVGLTIIGFASLVVVLRRLDPSGLLPAMVMGVTVILGIAIFADAQLSNDLRSLSGRVDLFAAAIRNFLDNPIVGTGRMEIVDLQTTAGRSAHNVFIAIAAGTGMVGLSLWVVLFVWALRVATRRWWGGGDGLWPACVMVMFSTMLVQQVTFAPLLWTTVTLLSGLVASNARKTFQDEERVVR